MCVSLCVHLLYVCACVLMCVHVCVPQVCMCVFHKCVCALCVSMPFLLPAHVAGRVWLARKRQMMLQRCLVGLQAGEHVTIV